MEEELNEDELEERLYAMIHYADESQTNIASTTQNVSISDICANTPRSAFRRYWRTSGDHAPSHTHYQKVNNPSKDVSTPQNTNKTINRPNNTQLQKVNSTPKGASTPLNSNKIVNKPNNTQLLKTSDTSKLTSIPQNAISTTKVITKPKEEKDDATKSFKQTVTDLNLFFSSPLISEIKTTVKILENDESSHVLELETSDEDEVVEVALPPKPIISIESSDEDEVCVVTVQPILKTENEKNLKKDNQKKKGKRTAERHRDISASPVPSVVSSVSDEFIRGDCIALNISSNHPDNHYFDFSLHGSDLIDTPSGKKKKKKNKDRENMTPVANVTTPDKTIPKAADECFATPKTKSKNKKQKSKSYAVTAVPNPDIYDSDSNQSFDASKKDNSYKVTEKSLPSIDVYESDSSQQSEIIKIANKVETNNDIHSSDSSISLTEKQPELEPQTTVKVSTGAAVLAYAHKKLGKEPKSKPPNSEVVDLTDEVININDSNIEENIVMANITGFEESDDYGEEHPTPQNQNVKLGSTKEPAILSADLDFDNLKGKEMVCKKNRYSLATLRAEMDKFYNESWGGENFNHREIQKSMSRDKSLWEIDPKDRMPTYANRRKVICNYCNRTGHRDDTCRLKTPVCHMCGNTGHHEPRCPNKICVNCGSPNYMYSSVCRNCSTWGRITCAECNQSGHPSSHCPDLWRRYHNTLSPSEPLVDTFKFRKNFQLFCSGCARRGHLVHTCRNSLPFSGLPINSPYVANYVPLYRPMPDRYQNNPRNYGAQQKYSMPENTKRFSCDSTPKSDKKKRQSKSPTQHENHMNKKRHMSTGDIIDEPRHMSTPINTGKQAENTKEQERDAALPGSSTVSENKAHKNRDVTPDADTSPDSPEKAPDFIPITSANHDKKGQIIQDNEVSDTSDVMITGRIYVTDDTTEKLKTKEGVDWLNEKMQKHSVLVSLSDINLFLNINGKLVDQEAFTTDLRDWTQKPNNQQQNINTSEEVLTQNYAPDIPKNRSNIIRKLSRAFESLKGDLGDPKLLFKELNYLQENHAKLLKQKVISPQKLSNNKQNINVMLTKLNMVLLGQAGLADGQRHLRRLHSLQEMLTNYRQKNISGELRREIAEHYHSIFTAMPRGDYKELLDRYYELPNRSNNSKLAKKNWPKYAIQTKKNKFVSQAIPKPMAESTIKIPSLAKNALKNVQGVVITLTSFRRRLLKVQPATGVLKKARTQLVRNLHSQILALDNKSNIPTTKMWKKIKKLKEQAKLFLQNNM